jgi:hypothetical protein
MKGGVTKLETHISTAEQFYSAQLVGYSLSCVLIPNAHKECDIQYIKYTYKF